VKKQVRVKYDNGRPDSVFGPYATQEQGEDMVSKAKTYAHVSSAHVEEYQEPK